MDIGGITVDPQILLPFGHVYDARIGGQSLGSASGMGDPIVGATFWLVNQPSAGPAAATSASPRCCTCRGAATTATMPLIWAKTVSRATCN
ncbi:transporter [Pseudomonas syringae]|uniref:transporter n=1 Tax=Pseudomonas syringae TaxID=317 RepID=UPI000A85B9F3|nr:transporter [Pseudomonas syringae]